MQIVSKWIKQKSKHSKEYYKQTMHNIEGLSKCSTST